MSDRYNKIKKYSLVSFVIFVVFAVFGFLFNSFRPEEAELFFSSIEEELSFVEDFGFFSTFLFIFINNTITVTIGTFLGVLFSFIPILFLLINGFVIGLVSGYVYPTFGVLGLVLSLAPHGVFELAALFIGMGSGIYLGVSAIDEIRADNLNLKSLLKSIRRLELPSEKLKGDYSYVFDIYLHVVIPLLFLAAVIESLLLVML